MKSTIVVGALLLSSLAVSDSLAQGQLLWGNNLAATPTAPQVRAPIYGVDPNNPTEIRRGNTASGLPPGTQTYVGQLLSGFGYTMAIYLGLSPSEVMANNTPPTTNGVATFRTGGAAGLMSQLLATDLAIPGGSLRVYYEFRAWDNGGATITS